MKTGLSDLVSLSSGERKGVIVLILIIIGLAAIQIPGIFRKASPASINDSTFFSVLPDKDSSGTEAVQYSDYNPVPAPGDTFELFEFDPNKISSGELRRLGISDRVIRTWVNYRLKGGKFYRAEDIERIYGIPKECSKRLIPYVKLKSNVTERPFVHATSLRNEMIEKKDLNAGDSTDFLDIPGIGPVLSGRIIRYRKLLGGYCRLDQLQEVYGLNDSVIVQIGKRFYADTVLVQRININHCPEEVMRKHPYIGRHLADGIARYRSGTGFIRNLNELATNGIMTSQEMEKLMPYLKL